MLGSKKFKEISDLKEKLNSELSMFEGRYMFIIESESEAAQLKDTITVLEKQLNGELLCENS